MARWDGWGDPGRRPRVSTGVLRLLRRELGLIGDSEVPARVAAGDVQLPEPDLPDKVRARLSEVAEVSTDHRARLDHAGGQSYRDLVRRRQERLDGAPDAVVRPADAAAVRAVLECCAEDGVAVVPWGGGTSVVGGVEPLRGRFDSVVALDLSRLDELVSVDQVSRTAVLQPGMATPRAERLLAEHGLTLGHAPQSWEFATIGGYVATRSAGQASTGVGRSDDMVLALTVQTPRGELVLGRAPKSAAGPDLRQLFVGSEGAFGVVTEATLRVRPVPAVRRYEGWALPSFAAGLRVMRTLVQDGVAPDVCRLSDEDETRVGYAMAGRDRGLVGAYLRARQANALVIAGWEGSARSVALRRREAVRVLRAAGAVRLGDGAGRSWERSRFTGPYLRDGLIDLGVLVETLETATTWSRVAELRKAVASALRTSLGERAVVGCHVSHLYPTGASLYFTVIAKADPDDPVGQWDAAKRAAGDAIVAERATITHHHAVGADHRPWLSDEVGELGVEVLRAVKATVDPTGVLNPGKLVP